MLIPFFPELDASEIVMRGGSSGAEFWPPSRGVPCDVVLMTSSGPLVLPYLLCSSLLFPSLLIFLHLVTPSLTPRHNRALCSVSLGSRPPRILV